MLNEKYQVSAIGIENGERFTGYLLPFGMKDILDGLRTRHELGGWKTIKIDPTTIQPIKVKRIKSFGWVCPNCNQQFVSGKMNHCMNCGIAIDWHESNE